MNWNCAILDRNCRRVALYCCEYMKPEVCLSATGVYGLWPKSPSSMLWNGSSFLVWLCSLWEARGSACIKSWNGVLKSVAKPISTSLIVIRLWMWLFLDSCLLHDLQFRSRNSHFDWSTKLQSRFFIFFSGLSLGSFSSQRLAVQSALFLRLILLPNFFLFHSLSFRPFPSFFSPG